MNELTKEQAWANIVSVVKQYRGLNLDEAEAVKQSLMLISNIVNPKPVEEDKV